MTAWDCVRVAFDNLRSNKLRTGLTMLGMIVGVSAVILMVAILQGASSRITQEFEKLGSSLILVIYQPTQDDLKATTRRIDGLTMDDVSAIRQQCGDIAAISPELPLGDGKAEFSGRTMAVTSNGVEPDYALLRNVQVGRGRFISDDDLDSWAKVCVIGCKVASELFKNTDPIGQELQLNGQSLLVVGVVAPKGRTVEGDADALIFIPLTTVQKRFAGKDLVGVIWAEPRSLAEMDAAKDQIWQLLMRRYQNLPGFRVDSLDNVLNSIHEVIAIFTMVLASIAGLALLVGGIGIMNIMLVSVTERTREIGLRKAVGATARDILGQFLIEAATISGVGGLAGIAMGAGAAYAIGCITQFIPALVDPQTGAKGLAIYVPPLFCIGAFAFSACIGVVFGVYPAIRAARLSPIDALRHE